MPRGTHELVLDAVSELKDAVKFIMGIADDTAGDFGTWASPLTEKGSSTVITEFARLVNTNPKVKDIYMDAKRVATTHELALEKHDALLEGLGEGGDKLAKVQTALEALPILRTSARKNSTQQLGDKLVSIDHVDITYKHRKDDDDEESQSCFGREVPNGERASLPQYQDFAMKALPSYSKINDEQVASKRATNENFCDSTD